MNTTPPIQDQHRDPSETVLYMLGGIDAKVDSALNGIQRMESSHATLASSVAQNSADIAVLKANQVPKTPWWSVASGLAGIAAFVLAAIAILRPLLVS